MPPAALFTGYAERATLTLSLLPRYFDRVIATALCHFTFSFQAGPLGETLLFSGRLARGRAGGFQGGVYAGGSGSQVMQHHAIECEHPALAGVRRSACPTK